MIVIAVSAGLFFEFDERRDLGQVQVFVKIICNSENLEAEIYNVHNFTELRPKPKPKIIPTSKLIHCPYGILFCIWYVRNVEDWNLEFDYWYEKHIKPHKM